MENIYNEIKKQSLPKIKSFHNDLLIHDRREILNNTEKTPFLHFTGTNGTHLFFLLSDKELPKPGETVRYIFSEANRDHIIRDTVGAILSERNRGSRQELILYFDGYKIRKINQNKADLIAQEYLNKMIYGKKYAA